PPAPRIPHAIHSLSPPQASDLLALKRQHPVPLTILGDQGRQSFTIDQHAALTVCQASRRESKQLIRQNYGTRIPIHFERGKGPYDYTLAHALLLPPQPADEAQPSPR